MPEKENYKHGPSFLKNLWSDISGKHDKQHSDAPSLLLY